MKEKENKIPPALTKPNNRSTGFYEAKGMVRHMVILNKPHKERLAKIATDFSITQGEVIEVLMDAIDISDYTADFEAKRESKTTGKVKRGDVAKALKDLSEEDLAELAAFLEAKKRTHQ